MVNPSIRRVYLLLAFVCFFLFTTALGAQGQIKLPTFFSDGMVLQRDGSAPVWGTASPGDSIELQLAGQTVSTAADENGAWSAAFKGLKAGGPFTLTINGRSDSVKRSNVYVGDVWLCSGQSNMAFMIAQMGDLAKADIATANNPQLHSFVAATYFVPDPYQGRSWMASSPTTISSVSAVAYYFGRTLQQKLNVPIGILDIAFPGSAIEGWFPPDGFDRLGMGPETKALAAQYAALDSETPKYLDDLSQWEAKFNRQDPGNKGFAQGWADPKTDTSDWKSIKNFGDWSTLGLASGGVVWVRKSIDIPQATAGKDLTMTISDLRNAGREFGNLLGTVYFNNKPVGTIGDVLKHTFTSPDPVSIKLPGDEIAAGNAVIAIRFFTQEKKAPWNKTNLSFSATDKKKVPMPAVTGDWLAKVEAELPPLPADAAASRPVAPPSPAQVRMPSLFYNFMLKQVVGYGIKGIVWYQGEANTQSGGTVPSVLGDYAPVAYRKLLPALIANWRELWKQSDLPFYIIQLPNTNIDNLSQPDASPRKSDWAALREAQLLTWETVPHTGLTVTIDTGNGNLHPPNKAPVGQRTALVALADAYGETIESSGPIYDSMTLEGDKIRLKFKHVGSGLLAKNGPLKEFAIASDNKKFVWADATIDGPTILVSSPSVSSPVAVRYAWADDPVACNLYNNEGLPASPFRTDDWPLH
jgi:sialate O-acetylesterase